MNIRKDAIGFQVQLSVGYKGPNNEILIGSSIIIHYQSPTSLLKIPKRIYLQKQSNTMKLLGSSTSALM